MVVKLLDSRRLRIIIIRCVHHIHESSDGMPP
jgi:hypothetical protein